MKTNKILVELHGPGTAPVLMDPDEYKAYQKNQKLAELQDEKEFQILQSRKPTGPSIYEKNYLVIEEEKERERLAAEAKELEVTNRENERLRSLTEVRLKEAKQVVAREMETGAKIEKVIGEIKAWIVGNEFEQLGKGSKK